MPAGIRDVAERAGVSVATVSHVLNRTRYVAPQTEQRVLLAIRKLKYYKNVHAGRLARGSSEFFGLIISDIENPFFPKIIKSFEAEAVKHRFDILLCTTNYDPDRTQMAVQKMIENRVRGVAVMTVSMDPAIARELKKSQIPVVFLELGLVERYISNIHINYAKGSSQTIEYLYKLGHRAFAFISGPRERPSSLMYEQVFAEALQQLGLPAHQNVVGNNKVEGGIAAVRTLLAQPHFPTAIFCSNDMTAIGAVVALEEAGLRVPEDVSVVGTDDIEFARLARPSLTTIRIPREQLGKLAFEVLDKMLRSSRRIGREHVLDTELVVRQSTASAPTRAGEKTSTSSTA